MQIFLSTGRNLNNLPGRIDAEYLFDLSVLKISNS